MKPETLTALSIDHSLGTLSPEVAELFECYLAHDPASADAARAWRETCQLAQSAVKSAPVQPTRLPPPAFLRVSVPRSRRVHRAEALRLAACLALGLGAGWLARSRPEESRPPFQTDLTAAPPAPRSVHATAPVAPPAAHFWSVARFTATAVPTASPLPAPALPPLSSSSPAWKSVPKVKS